MGCCNVPRGIKRGCVKGGNVAGYVVVAQMMGHPRGGATKQEDKRRQSQVME